ncbi:MAG TPA: zinc-dependent metalloprotease family protein [Pyrinomonadaceae bacterium]|nr:zinc-dependent metalloprotease family protein [Pyrinomonadaceae bacterium]
MKTKGVILAAVILCLCAAALSGVGSSSSGQALTGELWQAVNESSIVATGRRAIVPAAYRTLRLNKDALTRTLAAAPLEFTAPLRQSRAVLSLPMPDGSFSRFRVEESPVMESGLAARAPYIKTYRGQGIDDPTATARFDLTPAGFHAQVLSSGDTVYVDPYAKGDTTNYISYFKRDLRGRQRFECKAGDLDKAASSDGGALATEDVLASAGLVQGTAGTLRTYRLALAVTGEYTLYHSELTDLPDVKKQKALAALTTTLNRVNGIYERELSVLMILVNDELNIIYTDPVTDPYQSDNVFGLTMLFENQANLDAPKPAGPIGEDNYDIGHVMSTGFGGIASLESVCLRGRPNVPGDGENAQGFTGLDTPEGDGFDVDFVAHEMGHQFGGNHTFNGSDGSCGGNEGADSAFEPGSGSTIQAYAGICGTQDLQPHSDDYFHVKSLEEMTAFVKGRGLSFNGDGNKCSTHVAVANGAPSVDAGPDYTVPMETPFKLTAAGSDPDGDTLTYTWEEYDLGAASPAGGNDNDDAGQERPIFRSYKGTTDPSRTFPSLKYILNDANVPPGNYDCGRVGGLPVVEEPFPEPCITGEDLPSMERTMKFKVTARDNAAAGGGYAIDLAEVDVIDTAGPFLVTGPNAAGTWAGNTTETVSWDVANTNVAPVSAQQVKITLSVDGGQTFPYVLAESTPNDGSEAVSVPNTSTDAARVKVEAVGNIFFDISDADFRITPDVASLANHALASGGAMALASSVYPSWNFNPMSAIDGDRTGVNWGAGGGWNDGTRAAYPDWLEVGFASPRKLNMIRVYTLQDGHTSGAEPTAQTTASESGIIDFDVQTWSGSAWVTVPGGQVRGNSLAVRTLAFNELTTQKVRVLVLNSRLNYSRIVEVEALGPAGP